MIDPPWHPLYAIGTPVCAACQRGDHENCYDGDKAREQAEFDNWYTDGPPPWWGCKCDC